MSGIQLRYVFAVAAAVFVGSLANSWPLAVLYGITAATFVLVLARLLRWGR
jgi:hypothetical protein